MLVLDGEADGGWVVLLSSIIVKDMLLFLLCTQQLAPHIRVEGGKINVNF